VTPSQGNPIFDARYVVFVALEKAAPLGHFVEPLIAAWANGKWHTTDPRKVLGWIGPLPVLKVTDFFDDTKTWDEVFADKERVDGGWRDKPPPEYDL
jgi:hypothetical protein